MGSGCSSGSKVAGEGEEGGDKSGLGREESCHIVTETDTSTVGHGHVNQYQVRGEREGAHRHKGLLGLA